MLEDISVPVSRLQKTQSTHGLSCLQVILNRIKSSTSNC